MCRQGQNIKMDLKPLNEELNAICHLLALLAAHHILHANRIRVKEECVEWIHLSHMVGMSF